VVRGEAGGGADVGMLGSFGGPKHLFGGSNANIEHPTSNIQHRCEEVERMDFNVRCSLFDDRYLLEKKTARRK
jgi:hypothetical protein